MSVFRHFLFDLRKRDLRLPVVMRRKATKNAMHAPSQDRQINLPELVGAGRRSCAGRVKIGGKYFSLKGKHLAGGLIPRAIGAELFCRTSAVNLRTRAAF